MGCNTSKPGEYCTASFKDSSAASWCKLQAQLEVTTLVCYVAPKPPGEVRGLQQHAPHPAVAAVPRVKLVLLGDSVSVFTFYAKYTQELAHSRPPTEHHCDVCMHHREWASPAWSCGMCGGCSTPPAK